MPDPSADDRSPWAVFLIFLRLGLTSFGGPIAHLGYFRDEFVTRRQWLTERSYADTVALCQFLPGPASSQVGMALGLSRAGYAGVLAAWTGFTMPSALLLLLFASGIAGYGEVLPPGALHGLQIVAVAVVAQAVWGMARSLCPDVLRVSIMAVAVCLALLVPSGWGQVGVIAAAGFTGRFLFEPRRDLTHEPIPITVSHRAAVSCLSVFCVLLVGLPILAKLLSNEALAMADVFYRAGALVFGGAHVVLPLLQADVVPLGWVSHDTFLAGYGAAQAVPGPLFTFAAFLGASSTGELSGWLGGGIALVSIFMPSFLLVTGALPFWEQLRSNSGAQAMLAGVNAAVVGLLLAALYDPVWTNAILSAQDFGLALIALVALMFWKWPAWLVVLGCALGGWSSSLLA
jgi:chromate transporter